MNPNPPTLKRALTLWALLLYGIVLIQPTAPMPVYGAAAEAARGHVVTAILIGMVAMLFTAISYGRMANVYPSAGSAYTYVTEEIHPAVGYSVGWAMLFDYIMNPIICAIWCSKAALNFLPSVPYPVFAVFFSVLFTLLNLRGIETSTRINAIITACLTLMIVAFVAMSVRYLWLNPPRDIDSWTKPFYDPSTFSFAAVSNGASLAVLTYIGFDGVSTLSEEAHNPRRNILLATVLVCLLTGVLSSIQVYIAQLVWPEPAFPDTDTAFCYVARRAGGQWLFHAVNLSLLVATVGSGMGAQLGAGRLLYGMGRDNALPPKFFAAVSPRTFIPRNNIILVGVITLAGTFAVTYALGAELLNFGALAAFMGVNIACFARYYLRAERKTVWNFLAPLLGFAVCLYLWLSLGRNAKIVGAIWLAAGLLYGAWRTRLHWRDSSTFNERS